jgi:hypothetical protein
MTTKNRTAITLYIPNDWIEPIEEARGEEPRTEWILEAVREKLGKRAFPKPPGRGRPRVTESEG